MNLTRAFSMIATSMAKRKIAFFQRAFDDVVINRSAWLRKERASVRWVMALPSPEFGSVLRSQLRFHPLVQFFHHRRTVFPIEKQPAFRRQISLARQCVVMINATQRLECMPTLLRKVLRHFDNLAPGMRETVCEQHLDSGQLRCAARKRIAQLDWRRQFAYTLFQHLGDVLARMFRPGEEQRDAPCAQDGYDAAGECACALIARLARQPQIRMPVSSFVQYTALRCLPDYFFHHRVGLLPSP